jgi:hypothetical protein
MRFVRSRRSHTMVGTRTVLGAVSALGVFATHAARRLNEYAQGCILDLLPH